MVLRRSQHGGNTTDYYEAYDIEKPDSLREMNEVNAIVKREPSSRVGTTSVNEIYETTLPSGLFPNQTFTRGYVIAYCCAAG